MRIFFVLLIGQSLPLRKIKGGDISNLLSSHDSEDHHLKATRSGIAANKKESLVEKNLNDGVELDTMWSPDKERKYHEPSGEHGKTALNTRWVADTDRSP